MQNPFENPGFSMASLTAAINLLPNRYGRLEQLNLFPAKPVRTRQIIVEEYAGRLNLLPTRAPGSPGTVGERGKRNLRSFVIPHIPHDDVVLPEEVQGLRAFGSETEMEAIGGVMARHLETMRNKHAITLEHLRMGALKGKILDADGSELVDLFDEFDITAQSVSFEFSTAADNGQIKTACLELLGLMEDGLTGEFSTGVHVLCSTEFFRALTTHKEVKTAYQNWQQGAVLINDMRSGFSYSGITFEEYRGQASFVQADGTLGSRRFIAAGEAHAFPVGTVDTFATYFAPADFNETVNTIGQPLYAKQEPRKFDRGTDLAHADQPAADVPSPWRADQARCCLMDVATLYEAARSAGLLTAVTVAGTTVHCAFRAPDETVLDGFALSRDYQIDYPAVWLTLAAGDTVEVAGSSYQVRDVRAIGDGTERRASLSQL